MSRNRAWKPAGTRLFPPGALGDPAPGDRALCFLEFPQAGQPFNRKLGSLMREEARDGDNAERDVFWIGATRCIQSRNQLLWFRSAFH